jgi:tetratricopeptide (TPR) repeat protein
VGEAGVGKSRLLLELRGMVPKAEYTFLEGRCLHYGGSMPYLPVLDVLKAYLEIDEEDKEATIKEKLRERIQQLDEEAEVVPPALHEVLSLTVEDEKYPQLGPQQRRERTFEAIRDLLIRESQRRPLILAIEDLHWMDKTSEEFLDYLIGFLPTARILLILLYRPEYTHSWGSKSYYGKIGLDQLSAQTSAELVQALLEGGKVAPEIGALVLGRAGGNPLFVEELTHSLVENGSIQRKDNQFILTRKPSDIEVPDTIQGIIAARMDRIEDSLKRIMQVASVIGREFAYRILQSITGMSEELKASMLNLQGLEFIYEKQLFPELEYIFKHALTQEVAYSSLLLKRRREIHEKIGEAIEELYSERLEEYYELLAYHYVRSDNKEKAVEYLDLANQKAARASAMQEAKEYFDEAMKLLDILSDSQKHREQRISLLVNQWTVIEQLMQGPEYYDLLSRHEPEAANLDNRGLIGALYARLGYFKYYSGSFDQAIQTLTRAVEVCHAAGNIEDEAFANMYLQWSHYFKGDLDQVLTLKQDVLRNMEQRFNLGIYVYSLCVTSSALYALGRWNESVEDGQAALAVAQEFSDNLQINFAAAFLGFAYTFWGDLRRGVEYAELSCEKAPTPLGESVASIVLGLAKSRAGDPKMWIEPLSSILEIGRSVQNLTVQISSTAILSEVCCLAGEYDRATETLKNCVDLTERCKAKWFLGFARRLLGEVALATNPDEATPHFEQAISIFQEIKAENELALAYSGMGRYHKQQGNTEQAREYLTRALEIFERLGTLIEPDKVRKELVDLPSSG